MENDKEQNKKMDDEEGMSNLLSEAEEDRLLKSFVDNNGSIDESVASEILNWAEDVRIKQQLLDAVLQGLIDIVSFKDGDPMFRKSASGNAFVDSLLRRN